MKSKFLFTNFKWDVNALSKSLHLTNEEVREYFKDGRRCSFLIERKLRIYMKAEIAETEGKSYDLIDENNNKWEVRSLTNNGVYFCPSTMVGSSRKFDEKGFLRKLKVVVGYKIANIQTFPNVKVYSVSSEQVLAWYKIGKLGKTTTIKPKKFLTLINEL